MKNKFWNIINFLLIILIIVNSNCTNLEDKINVLQKEERRLISHHLASEVSSLVVQSNENEDAELRFGCNNNFFSFLLRGEYEDFILISEDHPVLSINKDDDFMIFSNFFSARNGLKYSGDFKVRGVAQWKLLYEEDFSKGKAEGWTNNTISSCNGISMLGGYCNFGKGETSKTYSILEEHNHIKIEATYHFIDSWDGETGYMKVDNGRNDEMVYAWTEQYTSKGINGINICGGKYPEGKFASPIKIILPHNKESIQIAFGSTITLDPCDESFGVSGIRIYIK